MNVAKNIDQESGLARFGLVATIQGTRTIEEARTLLERHIYKHNLWLQRARKPDGNVAKLERA